MTPRKATRAERRRLVEAMLVEDHTRSDRSIARACACSHSLIATVRRELVEAGRIDRRPGRSEADAQAASGRNANLVRQRAGHVSPAVKSGAESEVLLAPLRLRFEASLREEFDLDVLDDRRLSLLADLLSRIELARRWLDEKGSVVRNRSGEPWPIAASLEQWSKRADGLLRELHEAKREAGKVEPMAALNAHLVEMAAARESAPQAGELGSGGNDESEGT